MVFFAWEILQGCFFCCCSFIFILHFVVIFVLHFVVVVLHFISRLLCHVTGTPPLASKACEGLHQALSSTPTTLDSLLLFHLPQALRFWVGIYLPTGVFYLMLLHWHFSAFIKASWEPTVLPWSLQGFILILETQKQPICLFDSE